MGNKHPGWCIFFFKVEHNNRSTGVFSQISLTTTLNYSIRAVFLVQKKNNNTRYFMINPQLCAAVMQRQSLDRVFTAFENVSLNC